MKLDHGTYARIARQTGYTPSYIAMVANGQRRNARVELALAEEELSQIRRRNQLTRLRRIINSHKKCATSNPTSSN